MFSYLTRQPSLPSHGQHACFIYETEREQLETVVPYLKEGLARNERCCYVVHERSIEDVAALFQSAGIDVRREQERGALVFTDSIETYLPDGRFDPDERLNILSEHVRRALADGFRGLRSVGEMEWAICGAPGCERLIEYESRVNDLVPQLSINGLCQYNRRRTSPAILRDVLRTHPVVLLDGKAHKNLYYEPPAIFLNQGSDTERVEWMLGELKNAPEANGHAPVLVVEDDQEIRRRMGLNLERLGYNVIKAEDAGEALRLAVYKHPYFILTNSDLPWLGNLVQLIRREADLRDVPVVAIYPDRPQEYREDRILVLDNYRQLAELWPAKAA